MIRLTDNLRIGNSSDGNQVDLVKDKIGGLFNVASDLNTSRWWFGVEYVKVGLVDGPGNEVLLYSSAILALVSLVRRRKWVLVYDHDGGRALAVCMMYLNLIKGQYRPDPLQWSHWLTWEERLATLVLEKSAVMPKVHSAHKEAFTKIPYGLLEALL